MGRSGHLVAGLTHGNPRVRAWSAEMLGAERSLDSVGPLTELMSDQEPEVRAGAAKSLGMLGDPQALPALCRALEDPHPAVSGVAFEATLPFRLGAVTQLCEALRRGSWERSPLVMEALVRIGAPASGSLCALLSSPVLQVRQEAVIALGRIGDPSAVSALGRAMSDQSEWVRARAAEAMGRLQAASTVPVLIPALRDLSEGVRLQSSIALGRIGDGRAEDALIRSLDDRSGPVRSAAADALARLGTDRAILPLISAFEGGVGFPAARALHAVAARAPSPCLRAALPTARFWSRTPGLSREQATLYAALIQRIEEVTTASRDLPVPALPSAGSENLPRPAEHCESRSPARETPFTETQSRRHVWSWRHWRQVERG